MANIELYGPYWWLGPLEPFMPGQEHVWAVGPFETAGAVFSVSAHPIAAQDHQGLAVSSLSTAYAYGSDPSINFIVRNVSDTNVPGYRIYVSVVNDPEI
jgi:hypothetical protein